MTATVELSRSQPVIKDICLGPLGCGSSRVEKKPTFDLSLSENPFPPLPSVLHAVTQALTQANLYPEFIPRRLPKVIGDRIGVHADQHGLVVEIVACDEQTVLRQNRDTFAHGPDAHAGHDMRPTICV